MGSSFRGFLAAFWLTREESVWILPFLICSFFYLCILINKNTRVKELSKAVFIPLVICLLLIGSVDVLNLINYGTFRTMETDSKEFMSACGSIIRVKQKGSMHRQLLEKETRLKAAEFSPSILEIEPYLEEIEHTDRQFAPHGRIAGFASFLVFREAVAMAGHYHSPHAADLFYKKMSQEIDVACDTKKLECDEKINFFPSPWSHKKMSFYPKYLKATSLELISFDYLDPTPP